MVGGWGVSSKYVYARCRRRIYRLLEVTFRRIIVYPGGREEIENVTPKQLPAPASHTLPSQDEIEVGPSEIKDLDA